VNTLRDNFFIATFICDL